MAATIMDGAALARRIRAELAEEKARSTKRFESELVTKLAEKDAALETLVEERLALANVDHPIHSARAE